MATFNGGRYLAEQLDSIAQQVEVEINLIVSDDGSTDDSILILEKYKNRFASFKLIAGPRRGPAANFFRLLQHTTSPFVAFADQDDIWEKNHLIRAIASLIDRDDVPAMHFSSVKVFSNNFKSGKIHPKNTTLPSPEKRFFENLCLGCTMVLNHKLIDLVNSQTPKHAIMHDYWIYLVASTCGQAIFSPQPTVNYRIHELNNVGLSSKYSLKRLRNLARTDWSPYLQILGLRELHESNFQNGIARELDLLIDRYNGNLIYRIYHFAFKRVRYRTYLIDEIALRIKFCFK